MNNNCIKYWKKSLLSKSLLSKVEVGSAASKVVVRDGMIKANKWNWKLE